MRTRTSVRVRERAPRAQCVACNCELVWVTDPCFEDVHERVTPLESKAEDLVGWIVAIVVVFAVAIACMWAVAR